MDSHLSDGNGPIGVEIIRNFESNTFVFIFISSIGDNNLLRTPIISVSGDSKQTQQTAYHGLQIDSFFSKPLNSLEVVATVNQIIQNTYNIV